VIIGTKIQIAIIHMSCDESLIKRLYIDSSCEEIVTTLGNSSR